jgi:DNA-binding MarR family transcriptional regulator
MRRDPKTEQVASALLVNVGLLRRQLRAACVPGGLTFPETSALARLERGGPATAAALARQEQISPQSMGATLSGLRGRGLVARAPDPGDGRRILLSLTDAGRRALRDRRTARVGQLADAMTAFSRSELDQLMAAVPLIERLAHSL